MSRTGNTQPVSTDPDSAGLSPSSRRLAVLGTALLGVLAATDQAPAVGSSVLILAAVASYLLAFVVYMAIASLAHARQWITLVIGVSAGVAGSLYMNDWRWPGALTLAPVILSAVAVGVIARYKPDAVAFWTGALLLTIVMIARDFSVWREQIALLNEAAPIVARDAVSRLESFGLAGPSMESEWIRRMTQFSWFLPGLLTCSALVPFSVGSLWFFVRTEHARGRAGGSSFVFWKMPRLFLLVALFAVLGHLIGGAGVQQVADNVLLALAVGFAIVGAAALEYVFRARTVAVWLRAIVYIAVVVTHVYGLIALVAIGLVDTLAGWRRTNTARQTGKESVS